MIDKTFDNSRSRHNLDEINKSIGDFSFDNFKKMRFIDNHLTVVDFFKSWRDLFPEEIKDQDVWNKKVIDNYQKLYCDIDKVPKHLKSWYNWTSYLFSISNYYILDLINFDKLLKDESINKKIHYLDIEHCLLLIFGCDFVENLPILIRKRIHSEFSNTHDLIDKLKNVSYLCSLVDSLIKVSTEIPELNFLLTYNFEKSSLELISDLENCIFLKKSIKIKKVNFSYLKSEQLTFTNSLDQYELFKFISSSDEEDFTKSLLESVYKFLFLSLDKKLKSWNSYIISDNGSEIRALEDGQFPIEFASNYQIDTLVKGILLSDFLDFYDSNSSIGKSILRDKLNEVVKKLE